MLVDFIVELLDVSKFSLLQSLWILKTDGSSKVVGGGVGMALQSPEALQVAKVVKFSF